MFRSRLSLMIILLSVPILIVCSKPRQRNVQDLVHEYVEASDAHDLDKLASMTADSAVWILGNIQLKGKEEVLGPNRLDAGANTRLEMSNLVVRGDTAKFELAEVNDILTALGINSIVHYPRLVFKDGLVVRKDQWKPNTMMPEEASPNLGRFQQWIQDNKPDAIDRLFDQDGNFIFSRENGELMASLAREYSEREKE